MSETPFSEPLKDLLDRMGNTDPRFRLIAEIVQKRNASSMSETLQKREDQHTHNYPRTLEGRKEHKMILVDERDLKILIERNNFLASALGACRYCWGTDVTCKCKGEGSVGTRPPNKEAFTELVRPVLNRFGIDWNLEPKELNKNGNHSTNHS